MEPKNLRSVLSVINVSYAFGAETFKSCTSSHSASTIGLKKMASIRLQIMTTLFSRVYQVHCAASISRGKFQSYVISGRHATTIEEETVVVHSRGETLGRIRMPI